MCKQVRARLSYCVSDFVDVIKTLHIYVAMWRPHLLRDADLYRAEIEAKAWLLPVKMSEFDIGAYLGNLPQRDESIIVDAATGRCKLPDIFRSSEEITQVGRLLCEAGDFETGIRVSAGTLCMILLCSCHSSMPWNANSTPFLPP